MPQVPVIITRLTTKRIQLDWTSASSSDISYVFVNGVRVGGPFTGTLIRSFQIDVTDSRTVQAEIQDTDDTPASIWVEPNDQPIIHWRKTPGVVQYLIDIDGVQVSTQWPDGEDRQQMQLTTRLSDGWHEIVIKAVDENLDELSSLSYWYEVYNPGDPVTGITVTNGSGAGLYDITIP